MKLMWSSPLWEKHCVYWCVVVEVLSPPSSPPLLPRCRLRRPPLTPCVSLIISDKCIISQVFTLISSLHPFFCHSFPLAYPFTWSLHSFLCSPPSPALSSLPPVSSSLSPLQCVVLSLPPPSCLAICQPFPVSSLKWPAGSSHSLMNTNTEQNKKHINFPLASSAAWSYCNVRACCKKLTK